MFILIVLFLPKGIVGIPGMIIGAVQRRLQREKPVADATGEAATELSDDTPTAIAKPETTT
jgi:hypothetical protein